MKYLVCLLTLLFTASSYAVPVTIDPTTGLSGSFLFGGTSDIGSLQTDPADGWEITVATDSVIDIDVRDDFVIGDEFALIFDGLFTDWDSTATTPSGHFSGQTTGLFLSSGTHTFGFQLTDACCTSGRAFFTFSAVRDAVSVPSSAGLPLLLIGLAGIFLSSRRKV